MAVDKSDRGSGSSSEVATAAPTGPKRGEVKEEKKRLPLSSRNLSVIFLQLSYHIICELVKLMSLMVKKSSVNI